MHVRRIGVAVTIAALLTVSAAACTASGPKASATHHAASSSASASAPSGEGGSDAAPAAITWRASCMLTTGEVASALSQFSWSPAAAPVADDQWAGDTMCDYGESSPDSTREIDVDFRAYDPSSTYGFVSPDVHQTGFTAASPAAAAASACAVATSGTSDDSAADLCGSAAGVPYVVGENGAAAVAFPGGTDFYVIQAFGFDGSQDTHDALTTLIGLVAGRSLVGVSSGSGSSSTSTLAKGKQSACPAKLKSAIAYKGPYLEMQASDIDKALGATLPGDISCIVLSPGDTSGEAYVRVFWAKQDQAFANRVGQSLVADGMRAVGDSVDYQKNGADLVLYAYPAADDEHWSDDFPGSPSLVIGEGNIPDTGYFNGD